MISRMKRQARWSTKKRRFSFEGSRYYTSWRQRRRNPQGKPRWRNETEGKQENERQCENQKYTKEYKHATLLQSTLHVRGGNNGNKDRFVVFNHLRHFFRLLTIVPISLHPIHDASKEISTLLRKGSWHYHYCHVLLLLHNNRKREAETVGEEQILRSSLPINTSHARIIGASAAQR